MSKVMIIYGSSTGNTEFTAETISDFLSEKDYDVTMSNVSLTGVDIFQEDYDLFLLGCSTWGEEEIELQEDFEPFYDELNGNVFLNGKQFALFGCGDSSYTYFCGAVDVIEDKVRKLGGDIITGSLKIDGDPEEDEIFEWTQDVINAAE